MVQGGLLKLNACVRGLAGRRVKRNRTAKAPRFRYAMLMGPRLLLKKTDLTAVRPSTFRGL